jgi:hypothetical protein
MQLLQGHLHQCNPYVQDYKAVCNLTTNEISHSKIVINADARPAGEHKRRFNLVEGLKEISVLMSDRYWVRDIVLHSQTGGLQIINETHRAFDPLHYVLLFPAGNDGWNLIRHTIALI